MGKKDEFPSPEEPYTVVFDDENGAYYECCGDCCLLCAQTGCLLMVCVPCVARCPSAVLHCMVCKRFKKQEVTITDKQIEYRRGWLIRKKRNIPIDRVDDVTVESDWLLRLCGIKNLVIRTSTDRDEPCDTVLVAPQNAEMVRDIIIQRRQLLLHKPIRGSFTVDENKVVPLNLKKSN